MAYTLTRKAADDIIDIYLQGHTLFGADQAERYHSGMKNVFAFLAREPQSARERTEINPPIRVHPYGSHIILYLIDESGDILILRVRHGREDWHSNPL